MIETFLVNPFFATIFIAISAALLGVFVLWKKLSYFGDALSHSTLLGLSLAAIGDLNQISVIILFAIIFAFLVHLISQNRLFSKDVIVMILSYFCVATSVILNDIWIKNFSFSSYIFGDILTVENADIAALAILTMLIIFYVIFAFRKFLLINANQDLARIEGVNVEFWNLFFLILLSTTIALSARIVGVFLMAALLIFPAAIARIFSRSAKQMILLSFIISTLVATASFKIASSYNLNISSTIVIALFIIFVLSASHNKFTSKWN